MRELRPMAPGAVSRRWLMGGAGSIAALAALGACNRPEEKAPVAPPEPPVEPGPPEGSLEWAVQGHWRERDKGRDAWRHPMETLRFFGLQPRMTVVEFWPGAGWYTEILAPYLNRGGGAYWAALFASDSGADPAQAALNTAFQNRFEGDRRLYGEVRVSSFGLQSGPVIDPAGTADMVLFLRSIHAWMAAGIAEKAFADAYAALRPGGVLGIEQHRLQPERDQDPAAANGYVQEAFVRQLAEEAGFVFVDSSEINANPEDTKDHPFGVETLAPQRRTSPPGEAPDPEFDRAKYDAIGESDRMTLKFRKPE